MLIGKGNIQTHKKINHLSRIAAADRRILQIIEYYYTKRYLKFW